MKVSLPRFTFLSCVGSALVAQISMVRLPLGSLHSIWISTSCPLAARCTLHFALTIEPAGFWGWAFLETSLAAGEAGPPPWCVSEPFLACFAWLAWACARRILSALIT